MKTILFGNGFNWQREERVLGILRQPVPGPENIPPQEGPQGSPEFNLRPGSPEEFAQLLNEKFEYARNQTEGAVISRASRFQQNIQEQVDAIRSTPGISSEFLLNHIRGINEKLHPHQLHASVTNGDVLISTYTPPSPQMVARKQEIDLKKMRIAELEDQLRKIDMEINETSRMGFQEPAVRYRGFKRASMRRRNWAPEIAAMKAQLHFNDVQRSMAPLDQLYAERFQIIRELAGVRSGRIPVSARDQHVSAPEPTLPDARFQKDGKPDPKFIIDGRERSTDGTGRRIDDVSEGADRAKINRLLTRWKHVKTEEERETIEGLLMMEGVDPTMSKFAEGKAVMSPREERGMLFLGGLFKILKAFADRLGNKKTALSDKEFDPTLLDDPMKMTSRDRKKELKQNDEKLADLTKKKGTLEKDIADLTDKVKLADPKKEELEKELKTKKVELEKVKAALIAIPKRQEALHEAEKKAPKETPLTFEASADLWRQSFKDLYGTTEGVVIEMGKPGIVIERNMETIAKAATKNKKLAQVYVEQRKEKGEPLTSTLASIFGTKLETLDSIAEFHMRAREALAKKEANGDKVIEKFLLQKERMKNDVPVMMEELAGQIPIANDMIEALSKALGGKIITKLEKKDIDAILKKLLPGMREFMESMTESVSMEGDGKGQYRLTINASVMEKSLEVSVLKDIMNSDDRDAFRLGLMKVLSTEMNMKQGKDGMFYSPFMKPEEIDKVLLGTKNVPGLVKPVEGREVEKEGKERNQEGITPDRYAKAVSWYLSSLLDEEISADTIKRGMGTRKKSTTNIEYHNYFDDPYEITDPALLEKIQRAKLPVGMPSVIEIEGIRSQALERKKTAPKKEAEKELTPAEKKAEEDEKKTASKKFKEMQNYLEELRNSPLKKKIEAVLALSPLKKPSDKDAILQHDDKKTNEYNIWLAEIQRALKTHSALPPHELYEKWKDLYQKAPLNPSLSLQPIELAAALGRETGPGDTDLFERIKIIVLLDGELFQKWSDDFEAKRKK